MGFGSQVGGGGGVAGTVAQINLVGEVELMRLLTDLGPKVARRVTEKAVTAGARILIPAARKYAEAGGQQPRRRYGSLAKSIGLRRARRRSATSFLIVVGPRHQRRVVFDVRSGRRRKWRRKLSGIAEAKAILGAMKKIGIKEAGGLEIVNPGRYAWNVEHGHGGPLASPPHPFMRPAFESEKHRIEQTIVQKMWSGIYIEARKFPKPSP